MDIEVIIFLGTTLAVAQKNKGTGFIVLGVSL